MAQLQLGFVAEMGGGKTASTTYVKEIYPGTPSERFSDSLREFITWFNERKMAGEFAGGDRDHLEHALEEGLCASYPWEIVSRAANKGQFLQFADWVVINWLYADTREVKVDRTTMQELSTALRTSFAENILEQTIIARSQTHHSGSPITIIEGIRRFVDIRAMLKEPSFKLVYLECDPKIAYLRTVSRNENPGDAEMTFEEFMLRRGAEAESQIKLLKPYAHLVIDNNGDIAALHSKLRHAILLWLSGF